ncbi:MAG TPA: tetratricopeptide repeat protein [Candidatus Omnitrophota bacterium]|nr:tetratricopeptide repeat protein [Candidatus Omnitrophota bacterium]
MIKRNLLVLCALGILVCLATTFWGCMKKPEEVALDKGIQLLLDKRYAEAMVAINKALEINPNYALARYNHALVLQQQGDVDTAFKELNDLIKTAPNIPQPYNMRGKIYADRNQWDKAFADYQKSIQINNTYGIVYVNLAKAYAYKGDYEKAYQNVRKAIATGNSIPTYLQQDIESHTKYKIVQD